jgi:hypothetical protein
MPSFLTRFCEKPGYDRRRKRPSRFYIGKESSRLAVVTVHGSKATTWSVGLDRTIFLSIKDTGVLSSVLLPTDDGVVIVDERKVVRPHPLLKHVHDARRAGFDIKDSVLATHVSPHPARCHCRQGISFIGTLG